MGKVQYDQKGRRKISKSYLNKKRTGKVTKNQFHLGENKKARVIIRNLSFKVSEDDIKNLYRPFGEILEINLLKKPDGQPVGCAFVEFQRMEDASKAIFQTNKKEFLGRPIYCAWAVSKSRFVEKLEQDAKTEEEEDADEIEIVPKDGTKPSNDKHSFRSTGETEETSKKPLKKRKKLTPEERKELKKRKQEKRARIIIRNLSFKVGENELRKFFEPYGSIKSIEILKKPDGKPTGCAFVQFDHVQNAAKAVHYANLKKIHDRVIVVDFSIAKSKFTQASNVDIKEEPVEIKEEPLDDVHLNGQGFEDSEIVELEENKEEKTSEASDSEESTELSEEEQEDGDDDDDEDEDEEDDEFEGDAKPEVKKEEPEKRQKYFSHDVNEGKTVFIKNVPFSAKNEDLKACMEQFGPIYYALICVDPLTEYSKGTAFVKFRNVEDAEKCLTAGTELRLHDQVLDPHKALDRKELVDRKKGEGVIKKKDSRHLYLIKEGVILAGTNSAEGVSAADMAKRLKIEQWKSQILKDLNMFVSPTRLVVHNLPPTLNDNGLRKIFKKYAGKNAVIQEARVMRDMKNPDANGVGSSKEYGFVSFNKHEDALKALRSINNNPSIFSASRRPIVAFSIENRVMVNAKKRRVEKSRENNPLWKNKRKNVDEKSSEPQKKKVKSDDSQLNGDENPAFVGIQSKPGATIKLRTKRKLRTQAEIHAQTLKKEKKKKLAQKKSEILKNNEKLSRKEIRPKHGKEKVDLDDVKFNKLVDKYRSKLEVNVPTKTKWYCT